MWICYFCEVMFYVHKQAKTPAFDMLLQLKSRKKVIIKIDALTLALLKDTFSRPMWAETIQNIHRILSIH